MEEPTASPLNEEQPYPKKPKISDARKPKRYKRRKVAIFFGYCGVGYQGMQKNPGAKTIEGDLQEALYHSGAVPDHDRGSPNRYDWARSARTDKGVSAVGQVVSGRFYVDPPGFVDRLNSNLPAHIRIFGYKRVTDRFNAKKFCDRRRYVYLIPVFALDPYAHRSRESDSASLVSGSEFVECLECSERGRKAVGKSDWGISSNTTDASMEPCLEGSGDAAVTNVEGENANAESMEDDDYDTGPELEVKSCGDASVEKVDAPVKLYAKRVEVVAASNNVKTDKADSVLTKSMEDDDYDTGPELEVKSCGDASVEKVDAPVKLYAKRVEVVAASNNVKTDKADSVLIEGDNALQSKGNVGNGDDIYPEKGRFCYGEKERERLNQILKYYVGTRNFHNFTSRTKAEDPSAQRYIISFDAKTTVTVDGIEFVKCEVVGQSFMLHQIRKMIGLAVAIMRDSAPESLLEAALRKDVKINVPTAPEVGLYLDECFFSSYNQKWKDSHEEISMEAYEEVAEEFKMKHIYTHIASMEHKEGAVGLWLHSLNYRNYPDLRATSSGDAIDGDAAQVGGMAE